MQGSEFEFREQRMDRIAFHGAWFLAILTLIVLFALPAQAQYGASLQGTVTDTTGAVIPGATITMVDQETNRTLTATSDPAGVFTINHLAPSKYTITITRDGFKKKVLSNVSLLAEQANNLTVQLEVGAAAETVTVNAATTPVIDTETGNVGGTISQNDLAKMPVFGRDPFQLIQLAPGMFGDGSQGGNGGTNSLPGNQGPGGPSNSSGPYSTENRPQVSGNGGRPDTNGITIDGVQTTSVTWGSAAIVTPNPDTIKEMKVVANPYDASNGRFSGAQIQIISQNGTNQFHGTGLFKLDRPGLNAYQRWSPDNNPVRDDAQYNEFGGTVGGPIWKNKIFFFFGYDTIRNTGTATGGGWYDTASLDASATAPIASKFLGIKGAGVVYKNILEGPNDNHLCSDIGLVQGVNCNWIQGQGLDLGRPLTSAPGTRDPSYADPTTVNGNEVYTPGLGGDGTGSYANMDGNADLFYVSTVGPNNTINTQYNGRLDVQATPKDLIAYDIYYVPVNSTSYNGPNRASNIFYHNALNYSTGLLYNHIFSPTLLNEARADMAGWKWNELKDNPQSPLGLPNDNIALYDRTSFSNMTPAGFGPSIGSIFDQWTLNFKDVVTKVYKTHNLKFGAQYTRLAYLDSATWAASENFYFNNYWDFLNDAPSAETISGADPKTGAPTMSRKDDRQYIPAFFVQDDWKVKQNLTLNIGLRWEYYGGMTEKKGNNPRVNLGAGSAKFTDLAIVLGKPQVDAQKWNFGPQFGFAWAPSHNNGNLVIRGGIGLGYNGLEQAITTNTRFDPPFLTNSSSAPLTGSNINYEVGSDIYKYGTLTGSPTLISTFNSANLPDSGLAVGITGIDPQLKTSYVLRYSLEGQYDLGHEWVATLGYQGSTGRHLPLQYNLYNKYATQILQGQLAFNPIVNNIDWYEDTGTSNFNSMLAELRHQFSNSFMADVQYRWSKSVDNGSGPYTEPDYQFLPGYNWGPSDFDVRNMVKMFAVWSPNLFHGNSLLEKVAGGWTFSPIFNYHSGFPFNPTFGGVACNAFYPNAGNCNLRPAAYAGGAGTSQSTDTFKTVAGGNFPNGGAAYFTQPAEVDNPGGGWNTTSDVPTPSALPQVPGVGRNAFYGPRYSDVDFAVTKAFGLPNMKVFGENARFEVRANAFNLFNKLNIGGVDTNIQDSNFGRANNVLGSRTIEGEFHFKF
ncbi:MAG: TonB-dependent receptor [Acidobacteriota bacterium]|nr:TonB-dependent receptor [Acidobacteriota bacterium]